MKKDIDMVSTYCEEVLQLDNATLPDEYFYQSLPLCIIDAVYSIGVKYSHVQKAVSAYCTYVKMNKIRVDSDTPNISDQESVDSFCARQEEVSPQQMAEDVYTNRQRTSPTNGILKAEAVLLFAQYLQKYGVNYFQDLHMVMNNAQFEKDIRSIKGQGSGISLQYFWMLSGSENLIKPDRMVVRFLSKALSRDVKLHEAQSLLEVVSNKLKTSYPNINPRLLDYKIWEFQREQVA